MVKLWYIYLHYTFT